MPISGIRFRIFGINATDNNNRRPCNTADIFVFAPALIFAEVRTITDVRGRPPIKPETILPIPCAFNSRLVGVTRLYGSSSSAACMFSNVSRLATIAIVNAVVQTAKLVNAVKSGKVKNDANSGIEPAIGIFTRCALR